MLAISLKPLTGRIHATPWGRHVNEAEVEWPPGPWRLVRALISVWHRKIDQKRYRETVLEGLIERLADDLPRYVLPPAVHFHTRHYMPGPRSEKKSLVFDAFAHIVDGGELVVVWPSAELTVAQEALLDELLAALGYLGRAESWIEARRLESPPGSFNCEPIDRDMPLVQDGSEIVPLLAPLPAAAWSAERERLIEEQHAQKMGKKKRGQLEATLPERLIDALRLETADLHEVRWSRPPASTEVLYRRPSDSFRPSRGTADTARSRRYTATPTTARLLLAGKPRPRLEDAVRVGERVRLALLNRAKRIFGESAIPPVFSGHSLPEGVDHGHAFFIPEDADGDGHIDHVLIHAELGLDDRCGRTLDDLRVIYDGDGGEWPVLLEQVAEREVIARSTPLTSESREWISATPYLHPWHRKKKLTVEDQILRELELRGLPRPSLLQPLATIEVHGRHMRPIQFRRFRSKRGLVQPDTHGSFWCLIFDEPLAGPLALGFGCHFGLGLFRPAPQGGKNDRESDNE